MSISSLLQSSSKTTSITVFTCGTDAFHLDHSRASIDGARLVHYVRIEETITALSLFSVSLVRISSDFIGRPKTSSLYLSSERRREEKGHSGSVSNGRCTQQEENVQNICFFFRTLKFTRSRLKRSVRDTFRFG